MLFWTLGFWLDVLTFPSSLKDRDDVRARRLHHTISPKPFPNSLFMLLQRPHAMHLVQFDGTAMICQNGLFGAQIETANPLCWDLKEEILAKKSGLLLWNIRLHPCLQCDTARTHNTQQSRCLSRGSIYRYPPRLGNHYIKYILHYL